MNRHLTIGHRLPSMLSVPLFGDRDRYGRAVRPDDADWRAWVALRSTFYHDTQRTGIGRIVNDAGYRILRYVNTDGMRVLEIGPGGLPHLRFLNGRPALYAVMDVNPDMLALAAGKLEALGIPTTTYRALPTPQTDDERFDALVTFYSLEHLHPLEDHLASVERLLRPNGLVIGAIPAEGGLAWGVGRLATSRRYIKRNSSANPDKILCWEHPNFSENVLTALDRRFRRVRLDHWPLPVPALDLTLIARFIYQRRGSDSHL